MEPNVTVNAPAQSTCPVCHQPTLREYYFCPNCGAKLNAPPLSTTVWTQLGIYAFSIILPMICFLFVTKWPGMKYIQSKDEKAKQIGQTAWFFFILSTAFTIWFAVVWTQNYIKTTVDSINADMNGL